MSEKWTEIKAGSCPEGEGFWVTNPAHGGKVTCDNRGCNSFIDENDHYWIVEVDGANYYLHNKCYNTYEHYYGFRKPID